MDRAGYVYALLALVSIALGAWFGVQEYNLDKRGVRTIGTVYKVSVIHGTKSNHSDDYSASLTYEANGQPFDFTTTTSNRPVKGQAFPIVYDPVNPSVASIDGKTSIFTPAIYSAVSAVIFSLLTLYTYGRRLTVSTQSGFGSRMRNYKSKQSVSENEWL